MTSSAEDEHADPEEIEPAEDAADPGGVDAENMHGNQEEFDQPSDGPMTMQAARKEVEKETIKMCWSTSVCRSHLRQEEKY